MSIPIENLDHQFNLFSEYKADDVAVIAALGSIGIKFKTAWDRLVIGREYRNILCRV